MKKESRSFGFHLPTELFEKLRYVAREDGRSLSSVVRIGIERQVREFEKKNGEIKL